LVVVGADGAEHFTRVLDPEIDPSVDVDGIALPWRVPAALASRAIRDEAALLAGLGPLAPGVQRPDPAVEVEHDTCWVHLAAKRSSPSRWTPMRRS
jgi:hypothetical protein